jgi:hypothetical protein
MTYEVDLSEAPLAHGADNLEVLHVLEVERAPSTTARGFRRRIGARKA